MQAAPFKLDRKLYWQLALVPCSLVRRANSPVFWGKLCEPKRFHVLLNVSTSALICAFFSFVRSEGLEGKFVVKVMKCTGMRG